MMKEKIVNSLLVSGTLDKLPTLTFAQMLEYLGEPKTQEQLDKLTFKQQIEISNKYAARWINNLATKIQLEVM